MFKFLANLFLFLLVLFALIPTLIFKFFVTQILQSLWFSLLSTLYPELEFIRTITVRTLLDTHRNQGIGAVLLCINGRAKKEAVKRHLNEIVNRKSKNGKFIFPRLREALVTRFGTYAWEKVHFELERNLTVVPGTFKNRPVNDYNIQDYVGDLVSKYLPQNSSPWHVIIIPTSENHHYILLKLHHVLLNEHLNIGELLPLVPPTKNPYTSDFTPSKSPLVNMYKKPEAILLLREKLTEELSNYWNEFVSNYDPNERVELLKTTPNLMQFAAFSLITFVAFIREIRRGFKVIKTDFNSRLQYVSLIMRREMKKRCVNNEIFVKSILISINPFNFATSCANFFYSGLIMSTLRIPGFFLAEFLAFFNCITKGYCNNPKTFTGTIYTYVPLSYKALVEFFQFFSVLFNAPKHIISNILFQKEYLQSVTLCGRKCVAWSDPVKLNELRVISKNFNVSDIEILLAGLSKNLSEYLNQVDHKIPEEIAICLRNIDSNYIFATGTKVRPEDSCSGIICMRLPILNEKHERASIENLMKIKENFGDSLKNQQVSCLLTILQTQYGVLTKILPSTVLAIYLRYLSRKFAVSVTEITNRYPNVVQKTLWGEEVKSVIYFRPPQANTCISLCLNEYADHVRLGVMCDSRLVPNHILLARNFLNLH